MDNTTNGISGCSGMLLKHFGGFGGTNRYPSMHTKFAASQTPLILEWEDRSQSVGFDSQNQLEGWQKDKSGEGTVWF